MISRRIKEKIATTILRSPVTLLLGPSQIGKTTLGTELSEIFESIYINLKNRWDADKLKDIHLFYEENREKLIILDEVHRAGGLFEVIGDIVDEENKNGMTPGQFLFIGTASVNLVKHAKEVFGDGITCIHMGGIDALEYDEHDRLKLLWERGGYPESLLASSNRYSLSWRNDFIQNYIDGGITRFGSRISSDVVERFWLMLAHNQGTLFNAAELARSLGISGVSVGRHLDLMVQLSLVLKLEPWPEQTGKRVIKAPKVYVKDSGITHALLNIGDYNELLGHPVSGGSWEGFAIENILAAIGDNARAYFYKTSGGAEVDLVLDFENDERWAIEIKRSSIASLSRGFHVASEDIAATKKYLVYLGQETKELPREVQAISLNNLMQMILSRA